MIILSNSMSICAYSCSTGTKPITSRCGGSIPNLVPCIVDPAGCGLGAAPLMPMESSVTVTVSSILPQFSNKLDQFRDTKID